MMSSYVTAVYVNSWSWHVHGSHSVCLLKPGVTARLGETSSAARRNRGWAQHVWESYGHGQQRHGQGMRLGAQSGCAYRRERERRIYGAHLIGRRGNGRAGPRTGNGPCAGDASRQAGRDGPRTGAVALGSRTPRRRWWLWRTWAAWHQRKLIYE
jgi:hypothetical protein